MKTKNKTDGYKQIFKKNEQTLRNIVIYIDTKSSIYEQPYSLYIIKQERKQKTELWNKIRKTKEMKVFKK